MPTCPAGHRSLGDAYCDVCGLLIPTPPIGLRTGMSEEVPDERCPDCAAERAGRFCEACGHDFAAAASTEASPLPLADDHPVAGPGAAESAAPGARTGRPDSSGGAAEATWWAIVAADPAYYQAMADSGVLDPGALVFPSHAPQRRVPLNRARVRIGRRSLSRGLHPEIDLAGPPEDPAVSHAHAALLARPGGAWALVDEGSTNGTTLNGTGNPVPRNTEVALHETDRIYVGAWTVITLHRQWG
ncbi:FHA domain-containing protein [Streptomonospora litoralis]|uniref:FHA domain protein n=1 Tax=Streptomonospora litoralis TaxID=2498135 RepID=A0A4P6QAD5_9ACTN|nr:FHA domain-containing protein [Streptomonospora litoralis]QBI56384.1 FHA domain protein [Streptomonospora litoralis]